MATEHTILFRAELRNVWKNDSQSYEVVVSEDHVTWNPTGSPPSGPTSGSPPSGPAAEFGTAQVRISWVLKTELVSDSTEPNQSKLSIHYASRNLNKDYSSDLSLNVVTFSGDATTCTKLVDTIRTQVTKKVPDRPKRLLVIINPVSGKGKGEAIYREQVAPVFDLCNIKVDVRVTKRARLDSDDILDKYDLATIDGVIAVGGDGTFTEVVNALMRRTAKDSGIDEDDPDVAPKTPAITCSLIASGSVSGHAMITGFSKKPSSSAVVIAIGHTQPYDLVTVHCGRKLIAYNLLIIGYGQFCRIMSIMENNRWAGPARYLVQSGTISVEAFPLCVFFKRQLIQVEFDYLPSDVQSSESSDEVEKDSRSNKTTITESADGGWKSISGDYYSVDMTTIEIKGKNVQKPFFRQPSMADGNMNIWMTRSCGRMELVGFWNKLVESDPTTFDNNFVDTYSAKEYRIRATGAYKDKEEATKLLWDGDLISLPEPHAEFKNHRGVLRVFARDDAQEMRENDDKLNPTGQSTAE